MPATTSPSTSSTPLTTESGSEESGSSCSATRDAAPLQVSEEPGPKPAAAGILDQPGIWKRSPLDNGRRAAATLARAKRAVATLGSDQPFLIVYYGNDGAGGWQPLTVPLRTVTTLDRFGLCEPADDGLMLRMLQVPELARAMGFDDNLIPTAVLVASGSCCWETACARR